MIRLIAAVTVLMLTAAWAFSVTEKEKEAMFFAGITLLENKTDGTPEEKALKFRELEALTGISAAQAVVLLERYRERPADWQKIDAAMMKLLNDTRLRFGNNDSMKTGTNDSGKAASWKTGNKTLFPFKNKR